MTIGEFLFEIETLIHHAILILSMKILKVELVEETKILPKKKKRKKKGKKNQNGYKIWISFIKKTRILISLKILFLSQQRKLLKNQMQTGKITSGFEKSEKKKGKIEIFSYLIFLKAPRFLVINQEVLQEEKNVPKDFRQSKIPEDDLFQNIIFNY